MTADFVEKPGFLLKKYLPHLNSQVQKQSSVLHYWCKYEVFAVFITNHYQPLRFDSGDSMS
jgi:hypothetical protein